MPNGNDETLQQILNLLELHLKARYSANVASVATAAVHDAIAAAGEDADGDGIPDVNEEGIMAAMSRHEHGDEPSDEDADRYARSVVR